MAVSCYDNITQKLTLVCVDFAFIEKKRLHKYFSPIMKYPLSRNFAIEKSKRVQNTFKEETQR